MKAIYDQFQEHILRVKNLSLIYTSLNRQTTSVLDLSDILRAELVLAVSAFDNYIHGIVRVGMLESFKGIRPKTKNFYKFRCSLESILEGHSNLSSQLWLENEIRLFHSYQTFLQPDKITGALKLVSDEKIWEGLSHTIGIPAEDLKMRLNAIVDRRNKIAHEADIDPSYPNARWPINDQMVDDAIEFLEIIAKEIYEILK